MQKPTLTGRNNYVARRTEWNGKNKRTCYHNAPMLELVGDDNRYVTQYQLQQCARIQVRYACTGSWPDSMTGSVGDMSKVVLLFTEPFVSSTFNYLRKDVWFDLKVLTFFISIISFKFCPGTLSSIFGLDFILILVIINLLLYYLVLDFNG